MSHQEKQKQTEKFVGCILSVKTKPGKYGGGVQHIIGTVREIDVDSSEQAIVLDQAMSNGAMLPDGYVLLSSQIADLQVMGKANEIQANLKSAYSQSDALKSQESGYGDEANHDSAINFGVRKIPVTENSINYSFSNEPELRPVNGNHVPNATLQPLSNGSIALMNSITSAVADYSVKLISSESDNDSNGHLIAKPKPRKPDNGGSVTSQQKGAVLVGGVLINQTNASEMLNKSSTNSGLSSSASTNGENILLRTFGNLTTNGQASTVVSANKASPAASSMYNNTPSPSKLPAQKPIVYDHKKLGVLSQFVNAEAGACQLNNSEDILVASGGTPSGRSAAYAQSDSKNSKTPGKSFGRQRHGETFDGMSKDEMSVEFDFEGSNAQFEKLPVSATKPVKVTKNPSFSQTDTTYLADRMVESVKLKDAVKATKPFTTDTGIVIPSIDLSTRSKILNLAHEAGLTHSRVVEVMGRAVAQAALPLLGDSYRLSPERIADRPWVLVCTGPHWQGAVGIAAARTLASLGVHTCVHAPKEELKVCATEELLYNLSEEMFTRQIGDLKGIQFDLVIMALDDHLSGTLTLAPYARYLKNCPVVLVDPPLISSYRKQLDVVCGGTQKGGRRIVIVSPVLPIAYPSDSAVKLFLVNLGIPKHIFEQNDVVYKSPFGDKLVIQIFSGGSK